MSATRNIKNIVRLTKTQYNTLKGGTAVDGHTYDPTQYVYVVDPEDDEPIDIVVTSASYITNYEGTNSYPSSITLSNTTTIDKLTNNIDKPIRLIKQNTNDYVLFYPSINANSKHLHYYYGFSENATYMYTLYFNNSLNQITFAAPIRLVTYTSLNTSLTQCVKKTDYSIRSSDDNGHDTVQSTGNINTVVAKIIQCFTPNDLGGSASYAFENYDKNFLSENTVANGTICCPGLFGGHSFNVNYIEFQLEKFEFFIYIKGPDDTNNGFDYIFTIYGTLNDIDKEINSSNINVSYIQIETAGNNTGFIDIHEASGIQLLLHADIHLVHAHYNDEQ